MDFIGQKVRSRAWLLVAKRISMEELEKIEAGEVCESQQKHGIEKQMDVCDRGRMLNQNVYG